jgi:hypothetical protein
VVSDRSVSGVSCDVAVTIRRSISPGLYRLDARPRLRPDVPDPLLRRLAQPERAPEQILHVLAVGWNLSCSSISISGRLFFRAGGRQASPKKIAARANRPHHHPARREVFAFGLLFRLQEYLIAWGWAPLSDLLRVDVLNTIGLSMMLMGVLCWLVLAAQRETRTALALILSAAGTAIFISLLTPPLWTTWRPTWLPWPLESYINGVHNLGTPQAWLFPIFPWTAFAFAGLAAGFILQSEWARERESLIFFIGRRGGTLIRGAFALARRRSSSALRGLRLLAHQPKFLSDSRGDAARDPRRRPMPGAAGAQGGGDSAL